jgi:hypothetical protein
MPWDPSGGNWEEPLNVNWLGVMIGVLIVLGMVVLGFLFLKDPKMIIMMAIVGVIIAIVVYATFFTDLII